MIYSENPNTNIGKESLANRECFSGHSSIALSLGERRVVIHSQKKNRKNVMVISENAKNDRLLKCHMISDSFDFAYIFVKDATQPHCSS